MPQRHRMPHSPSRITAPALMLSVLMLLVATMVIGNAADSAAAEGAGTEGPNHGIANRVSEPVVLMGADLTGFTGATEQQLWLWAYDHGSWQLLPVQLDERDASGDIVASEDGALDANDEVVFTLDQTGEQADGLPPGMDPSPPTARIEATDPVDGSSGVLYLILSAAGPEIAVPPQVRWNPDTREISSDSYVLGFADMAADGFVGLKRFSLFDSEGDLLDRMKIRARLTVLGQQQTRTEETLPAAPFEGVVKAGLVRVVLTADGETAAYASRVAGLKLTELGQPNPTLQIDNVTLSLDWLPDAGPATYRDANVPDGVTVDGTADPVPATPLSAWREIEFLTGRLVALSADTGAAENLYADGEPAANDTGDGQRFGEFGIGAAAVDDVLDAAFPGDLVVLPAGRAVTGQQLSDQRDQPVAVSLRLSEVGTPAPRTTTPGTVTPTTGTPTSPTPPTTGTPTTGTPTSGTPTTVVPPTTGAPPTATVTPGVPGVPPYRIWLPFALKQTGP